MNTFGPSKKVSSIHLAAQMLNMLLSIFASSKVRSGLWPACPINPGSHNIDMMNGCSTH